MKGNNSERLFLAVSVFTLAAAGVATGLTMDMPVQTVDAFGGSTIQTEVLDYYKTEQGFKVVLTAEHFQQIESGLTLQTFLKTEKGSFGLLLDQVPVDAVALAQQYGLNYKFELHFVMKDMGFDMHSIVKTPMVEDRYEIDEDVGVVVQIPQNFFIASEHIQLTKDGVRTDQLNDDGIIYAVLYTNGTYKMEELPHQGVDSQPEDGGLYAVVTNEHQQEKEPESDSDGVTVQEEYLLREENMVDEVVTKPDDGLETSSSTTQSDKTESVTESQEPTRREEEPSTSKDDVTAPKENLNARAITTAQELIENGQLLGTELDKQKLMVLGAEQPRVTGGDATPTLLESGYKPDEQLTRGQFSILLAEALGLVASSSENLTQVELTEQALTALAEKGYINEMEEDIITASTYITNQQGVVILGRILEDFALDFNLTEVELPNAQEFSSYARSSLALLANLNIIQGSLDNFQPHKYLTQSQSNNLIANTVKLLPMTITA